ncbi:hypothetical protein HPP92_020353 [Vanilla planifolia]|uniref:Hcy-binding domain-containing protein n=1 Tax=Vanilla planifolia TaxID=51239 RepID=A0A835Q273_VANPL|nr:hypothetical protein HPP92_020353 [Vanilla planifolia]
MEISFRASDPALMMRNFLQEAGGFAVIDGGLATELEANGADLKDALWSAKCLFSSPDLIKKARATIQGFISRGFSNEESEALLRRSVELAHEARHLYERRQLNVEDISSEIGASKHPILVAASVGGYGAYLADGSEYSGDYGENVTLETLKDFHRRRLQVLVDAGPDIIAFETIPNKLEAQAYVELLEENNMEIPAWFSFNSKDGINVASGDSLSECVSIADACKNVVAIGINCTPPRYIHNLILSIIKVTDKPILIYPNSGETYDAVSKQWVEQMHLNKTGEKAELAKEAEQGIKRKKRDDQRKAVGFMKRISALMLANGMKQGLPLLEAVAGQLQKQSEPSLEHFVKTT